MLALLYHHEPQAAPPPAPPLLSQQRDAFVAEYIGLRAGAWSGQNPVRPRSAQIASKNQPPFQQQ
jgi:hypothetical protein